MSDRPMAIGSIIIACIITVGYVALLMMGKNPDGLSYGYIAVISAFLGGAMVHSTVTKVADVLHNQSEQQATQSPSVMLTVPETSVNVSQPARPAGEPKESNNA